MTNKMIFHFFVLQLYWIGPLIGGACAALIYRFLLSAEPSSTEDSEVKGIKMKSVSAA